MGLYEKLRETENPTPSVVQLPATAGTSPYGRKALQDELATLAATLPGSRNNQLNRTVFAVSQLVAAGHVDAATAWAGIETVAGQIGLDASEVQATMRSGWTAGTQQPRQVPELQPAATTILQPVPATPDTATGAPAAATGADVETVDGEPVPPTTVLNDQIIERFPLVDLEAIWDTPDDTDWILYPLIAARRASVIYSAPKVGKSLLALEIAAHLAEGTETLGITPDKPTRVLYVDYENDPRGDTVERLKNMGFTPDRLKNLMILSYPVLPGLDTMAGASIFSQILNTYHPELVVLDTMSRAIDGEENENDTYLNFYRMIELPMKKAGIALLRLDHTGKDEAKGQRGGSAKSGDVDLVWHYMRVSEYMYRMVLDANRLPVGETQLTIRRDVRPLRHVVVSSGEARQKRIDEINQILDEAGLPNDVGRPTARQELKAVGQSARTDLIEDALRERKQRPYGVQLAWDGEPNEN